MKTGTLMGAKTMKRMLKAVSIGSAALLITLAGLGAAQAYPDVLSGIQAHGYEFVPELWFSWSAVFHQDTFVTSNLIESGGGPAYSAKPGGYLTVGRVLDHSNPANAGTSDRIVTYGAGNIFQVTIASGSVGGQQILLPVDSRLKFVLGNLAVSRIEVCSPGDSEVQGTANAQDSLTGANLTVPASRLADSNNDGVIIYKTYFNVGVVQGNDPYYDYNRDGQVVDARLNKSVANYATSDRPFIAVYETSTGASINLTNNPPLVNHDNDASGSRTDNLWVGNPYTPVDADPLGGPRGTDGESPDGTPEADPNVTNIDGFDSPLLVGEIKSLYFLTVVNLLPGGSSNQFMVSTGVLDVEITDGRLYDWYVGLCLEDGHEPGTLAALLNASMLFRLGQAPLTTYEYVDDGTLFLEGMPCPEPSALLLVLGSAAGLVLRRRK